MKKRTAYPDKLTIRIDRTMSKRLDQACATKKTDISTIVRAALTAYLNEEGMKDEG